MKQYRKQFLALLLVVLLVTALLSVTTSAADGGYEVWVSGIQVTDRNRSDVLGMQDTGAGVRYDPATKTLTLTDASVTGVSSAQNGNAGIYAAGDLVIRAVGACTVSAARSTAGEQSAAICVTGALTLSGTGTLHAHSGAGEISAAISASSVTVTAGNYTMIADNADAASYGIETGDLTVTGGAIYAVAGDARDSVGMLASGAISISGGTVRTAAGVGSATERGISAGRFAITGGTVIVGAGAVSVYAEESLTIGSGVTMIGERGGYKPGETKVLYQREADSVLTLSDDRAEDAYGVYIGGIPVTPKNCKDVLMTGSSVPPVSVTPAVGKEGDPGYVPVTVTLNAAFVYGLPSVGIASIGITAIYDVRVVLVGDSTFVAARIPDGVSMLSTAMYGAPGEFEVTGSGSLTLLAEDSDSASYGIYAPALTVDSGEIRAVAGDGAAQSFGIVAERITLSGGRVTAEAGASDVFSAGVYGIESLTVNGGLLAASGDDAAIYSTALELHEHAEVTGANEDPSGGDTVLTQKDPSEPVTVVVYQGTLTVTVKDQVRTEKGKWSSEVTDIAVSGLLDGDRVTSVALKADGHRLYVDNITVKSADGTDVTVFYRLSVTEGVCHTRGRALPIGNGMHQYLCADCGAFLDRAACTPKDSTNCEETGTCTVCGGALGEAGTHLWDAGHVIKEPTAVETGLKQFTCTRCGKIRVEILPKLTEDTTEPPDSNTTEPPEETTTEAPKETTTAEDEPPMTSDPESTAGEPESSAPEETTSSPAWGETTDAETSGTGTDDEKGVCLWWLWLILLLILLSKLIAYLIWRKRKKDAEKEQKNGENE